MRHRDGYDISKWAYAELRGFCRQYQEKRDQAQDILLQVRAATSSAPRRSASDTSAVDAMAARRDKLVHDMSIIEECAREIDDGIWYEAIMATACMGRPYRCLAPETLPTSNRNAFFRARRRFFYLLWLRKTET